MRVQVSFSVPPSQASIIAGGVVIPSAVFGILLGSFLVRHWNLRIVGNAKLLVVLCSLTTGLTIALMFTGCNSPVVGISTSYQAESGFHMETMRATKNLTAPCNAACGCSQSMYEPVCLARDRRTYLSGCHAGCTHWTRIPAVLNVRAAGINFTGCACAAPALQNGADAGLSWATSGKCEAKCPAFLPFLILLFLQV